VSVVILPRYLLSNSCAGTIPGVCNMEKSKFMIGLNGKK
jgi:hypothetical protein